MNKLILFIICALSFSLNSCDKDDTPAVKPKTELLTQSSWKFKAATANGSDVSNQNPPFAPCRKDNIITFVISGTGTVSEGATACSPAENASFTWNFTSDESMIHFSTALYPNAPNDVTVVSVSETELVISFPYTVGSITVTVIVTFQH